MHNTLQHSIETVDTIAHDTFVTKQRKMRICFVTFMFSPIVGGAEARAEKQARQLQSLGHDVTIVTLRYKRQWQRRASLDGLPVIRVGGIFKRNGQLRVGRLGHMPIDINLFLTLWQLRRRYDILHVFQISPLAAIATLIGKLTRKPVVISSQCADSAAEQHLSSQHRMKLMADTLPDSDDLNINQAGIITSDITVLQRTAIGGRAMLRFLRASDAIFQALSTRSQANLIAQGFRQSNIVRISGSVNTVMFRPDPQKRPDPRQPERAIVCVARLEYSKGVDVLLHAWARLLPMLPDHLRPTLWLVGEGVLKAQLTRIAAALHIQESITFLGSRKDILDLLQQAWAFVLPSRYEGMPNALLEAMACGLPCVATQVSGSEDLINNNSNGLLVPSEQPAALAFALRSIIEDTDLAQQLGNAARATVERDYQLSRIVNQCAALYSHLLASSNTKEERDV